MAPFILLESVGAFILQCSKDAHVCMVHASMHNRCTTGGRQQAVMSKMDITSLQTCAELLHSAPLEQAQLQA